MEFRLYKKGDIWNVINVELINQLGFDTREMDLDYNNTWVGIDNETIIGCAGFRYFWNGVYECWLVSTDYESFNRNKIQITRFIRGKMKELKAHRIQATVLVENIRDCKFIKILGFKYEGLLKKYGPNKQDYFLFAWVK